MIEKFSIRFVTICLSVLLAGLLINACAGNALAPTGAVAEPTSPSSPEAAAAPAQNENAAAAGNAKMFQIVQDGTEARFYIDEVLMGKDKTVVGVTSQVEGELTVDPANPSSAHISAIRIDARDLTTDSGQRNGAIRRFVLQSNQDQYQYITFEPTTIEGMPAAVNVGDTFAFQVTGNLIIRDVSKAETFEVTVTVNSETELVGLGKTSIQRADYNLTIPSVPSVANVAEEVPLEIEFTARAD
ncbi:MAG: YceI family protein [Caldilineaceae bacterium]